MEGALEGGQEEKCISSRKNTKGKDMKRNKWQFSLGLLNG